MKRLRLVYLAFMTFIFAASIHAAIPTGPLVVTPGRISRPLERGTAIGGHARDELTLLGIRFEPTATGGERLALIYGDRFGKPLSGAPGYFHITIDRESHRVVIDLAQMQMTAVSPARLAKMLSGSKLVVSSEMTMDPIDNSTNITLQMKTPVSLKVGAGDNEPANVFLEMTPLQGARL